jgi:hypothetical protein
MTKKKFAELELSLLHLQQNVEIPETHLIIHPAIQRAVEQVGCSLVNISSLKSEDITLGSCCRRTSKHIVHTSKATKREFVPQHFAWTRQHVDQGYSSSH